MASLCVANKIATYISGMNGSPTSQGEASLECSILDYWDQMGRMGWDGLSPKLGITTWRGCANQGSHVQGMVLTSIIMFFLHLNKGMYSMVEHLPGMHEGLGLIPNTEEKS